jgi:LysM repeat protein
MFQSHSSITPPGYASTEEVSEYMVTTLGGKLRKSTRNDVLGLQMFQRYDHRGYHVRGYTGDDKPDHCAHLGLFKDVLKVHLAPRWHSPKGRRGKRAVAKEKIEARRSGRLHVVTSGEYLTGIAKHYGITVSALRDANGLERGKPLQIGQELVVPEGGASQPAAAAGGPRRDLRPGEKTHTVASGQSLGAIARRYHVKVRDIRERNGVVKGGRKIQPGDELIIPVTRGDKHGTKPEKRSGPKLKNGEKVHVVAKGQSLGAIAKRYHVKVSDIRERNDLPKGGRKIQPGDKLVIPNK